MLSIRNVNHSYDGIPVLKNLNLEVNEGKTLVLMGPSGCGKSTILRCMNGTVAPDNGEIIYRGKDILKMNDLELDEFRNEVSFVFQRANLIKHLNVIENVAFPLIMRNKDKASATKRAIEALESVDLLDKAYSDVRSLSGGQMQRVAIARAVSLESKLILWDEPTSALDPVLVLEILSLMERIAKRNNTTMVVVTHEINFAYRCADKIAFMDNGRIVEDGFTEEVLNDPKSKIAKRYCELLAYRSTDKDQVDHNSFIYSNINSDNFEDRYVN